MKGAVAHGLAVLLVAGAGEIAPARATDETQSPGPATSAGAAPAYPAAFYAPFQPRTALDMLERTPGFALSEGADVRGFGGAAGNVLVDGQRPTVKAGGIGEVLRRIPAARVERIELLRGGEAAQAQGQALVANVLLSADARGSGSATLDLARTLDGKLSSALRASYARPLGAWESSIELSAEIDHFPSAGHYRLRDPDGTLVESRRERIDGRSPEIGLAFSASRPLLHGTFAINGRVSFERNRLRQFIVTDAEEPGSPAGDRDDIAYDDEIWLAELGVDWTRPLGRDWSAKLVALGRMEHLRSDETFDEPGYRGVTAVRQRPLETVARMTLGREGSHALRPEFGAEVAWNALTSRLDYAEDLGSGLVPVDLSGADMRVTELRGEAFVNLNATLGEGFGAEAGLAFERSRIRAVSDLASAQSLSYLKPSAALSWSPSGATDLRLGMRRTVDQLDFGDFAASVDQVDGRPLGGNAQLRPARITRLYARLDQRWGEGGALSAEVFHQWHDGLLGYLLLPSGDQALGTVGDGRQWGITAQGTVPLSAILPGAQIRIEGTLLRSRMREALTRRTRRIDDLPDGDLTAEFRHDFAALRSSWGVRYVAAKSATVHFIGEDYDWRDRPVWTAYAETSAMAGFKAVLTVEGLTGRNKDRLRRFHALDGSRSPTGTESRRRREGAFVSLSLIRSL